jgi:beta-lactamase superfamily II metal-dependent hydrolase
VRAGCWWRRGRASASTSTSGPPSASVSTRVHVLAVGQADALVLELPSGRLAVVDFGHAALLDYLDALDPGRARRYAFCLLTHAHHDHYACLAPFIARHDDRVDEYWFSVAATGGIAALEALRAAALRGRRGRLLVLDRPAAAPYELEPGVTVVPFAPSTAELLRTPAPGGSTAENNRSIVLLLRHGRAAALLGADAEGERWARIAAQADAAGLPLAADLVKAPHHGAADPRGLPDALWPTMLRGPGSFVSFSVGRQRGRPDLGTVAAVRGRGRIRCTGRALICRPLPPGPGMPPRQHIGDLLDLTLARAPEARGARACFGTQVYDLDPGGAVTLLRAETPAFLDACLAPDSRVRDDGSARGDGLAV